MKFCHKIGMQCYEYRLNIVVLTRFFIYLFVYLRTIYVNVVPYKYIFYEVKLFYPANAMYLSLCEYIEFNYMYY